MRKSAGPSGRRDRADDAGGVGAEDGVAGFGGEGVGGDDALVDVGGLQAARGGDGVEVGLAGVDPGLGLGGLGVGAEADAVEGALLRGLEVVDPGVVGGAELGLGDLDLGGEGVGGDAGVGDLPRLGAGVAVGGVGVVLGGEVGVGGGGDGLGQECGVEAQPVEAAALAEEGEDGQRAAVGQGRGGLDAAGEEVAGGLAAEQFLEFAGGQRAAFERGGVGLAVERAVGAVEGGGGGDLGAHGVVAGGEAEPLGLAVEGGVVDEPRQHHVVDAVLARLGHGERAAGLLLEGAQLLLHGADVVVGGDRVRADAGDALAGNPAAGADAEAGEADDEPAQQDVHEHACASVAEASEHASRPRRKRWPASYALAAGVARGGDRGPAKTGGCGDSLDAHIMHNACTARMPRRARKNLDWKLDEI